MEVNLNQKRIKRAESLFGFLKGVDSSVNLSTVAIPMDCGAYIQPLSEWHLKSDGFKVSTSSWFGEEESRSEWNKWFESEILNKDHCQHFALCTSGGLLIGEVSIEVGDEDIRMFAFRGYSSEADFSKYITRLVSWCEERFLLSNMFVLKEGLEDDLVKSLIDVGFVDEEHKFSYIEKMVSPDIWPKMILTAGSSISEEESLYALDAAQNGWNNQWSKYICRFEKEFAEYVGTKYAIATSSCTGALHLSLLACGVGPGDEVIVPDSTWVASANAILYTGATPVFADIQNESWCLDPISFESKITSKTKAVVPVHMYGHPAKMDEIIKIARKHNLAVVEDAAPSIGAKVSEKRTGSFGDFGCFSFQGAKLLVTGEGGMIVTNDDELYRKVSKIWDQGRIPGSFWIDENGWKYKMSNVQAAIGLGQLHHVDMMVEAKRRLADWYDKYLADIPGILFWKEASWARSIYWMSSLLVTEEFPLTRDELIDELKKCNIDTRPVFPAISQYPIWPVKQDAQPIAKRIGEQGVNLPSGVKLGHNEIRYICNTIRRIAGMNHV